MNEPRTIENHYREGICIFYTEIVLICIMFSLKYLGQIKSNFKNITIE